MDLRNYLSDISMVTILYCQMVHFAPLNCTVNFGLTLLPMKSVEVLLLTFNSSKRLDQCPALFKIPSVLYYELLRQDAYAIYRTKCAHYSQERSKANPLKK